MEQALSGVRVLDVTHYIAGPYCTKLLADYGAEVVKVERPGTGDGARRIGPFYKDDPHPEKSGLFLYLNTNKRGVTLNLKSETGIKIFRELVADADILVENFNPRVMPSLGLDYESLERINPGLVMTSISNFGQTGPYRDYKATEIVADAMGGWMSIIGHPGREPLKPGGNQAQFVSGLFGGVGTMTAFHGRELTGVGQHVDISLMDAVLYIQMNITQIYHYHERITGRIGNMVLPPPGSILPCRDGYIGAIAVTNSQWQSLCEWMGKPELASDERFLTRIHRTENVDELIATLIPWLLEHDQEELLSEAQKRRIPFGIPAAADRLLNSEHLNERGYFVDVEHPFTGKVRYPGAQFGLGDLPYELKPAPLLGEHNEEIYCRRLGYNNKDLVKLRETGVI
ncbi:MAG: CoA transferase [Dehalococcoidales bacterium]|nr:CoA transferase [Dehalococcoidales bacterium]